MDKKNSDGEGAAIPSAQAAMMKALGAVIFPLAVKAALALEILPVLEEGRHASAPALATHLGLDTSALGRLLSNLQVHAGPGVRHAIVDHGFSPATAARVRRLMSAIRPRSGRSAYLSPSSFGSWE